MQTQCPHCETKFRVTETQIQVADGFVRCGVCKEVFNAIEVAGQHRHQQSLLNAASDSATFSTGEETEASDASIIKHAIAESEVSESLSFDKTPASEQSEKDTFAFFHKDSNDSALHVVPDKFRNTQRKESTGLISTSLWIIGTLLLTATLLIEYTWFNRNQLSQFPELQTVINKLCQQIECKDLSMRDPSKIELITRNIYSHPNEKEALMVNVTMKNNAHFAQPYPVLQIDFSDVRGGVVSGRRFFPAEYMPMQNNTEALHLLQPDTETTVTLEIIDPGKQAMTYEFNFL